MCTYRALLLAGFLFGYSAVTFADSSYVVDREETQQEKVTRLSHLMETYKKYQIKPQEKFIITGNGSEHNLSEMQIVYRNYAAEDNHYVFISGVAGTGRELVLRPESVKALPDLAKDGVDSRISHWIFEKNMTSPAAKYYGDKYDDYINRNVEFARKVVNSEACDTVISVDVYDFGGTYLNAWCGDRREIKQFVDDFENGKPLEVTIKETYLVMPKDKLDALRQSHSRK